MAVISNQGTWIAFAPKAGFTSVMQYAHAGVAQVVHHNHQYPSQPATIICRDPLLRAISIYYYNMCTMPYNNNYNRAIADDVAGGAYKRLYEQIRRVFPQPSELPVDADRFLYWIEQVLPNTIHTDGHTMTQTTTWILPGQLRWHQLNGGITWWCLQDLNHHLLQEFGWVTQVQNRQDYHRKRALKYLELDGVRDAIHKYYAEDFTAYETALQQRVLR